MKVRRFPDDESASSARNAEENEQINHVKPKETLHKRSSLSDLHPDLAQQWHPTKNGELSPAAISYGSAKIVWWVCQANAKHEWQARVAARSSGQGCPFCAGRAVDSTNSLASLRPDIAWEWHPKKNGGHLPTEVTCGSNKKVWWQCSRVRSHDWCQAIKKRTTYGFGCPFCATRGSLLTDANRLSAHNPEIAAEWHPSQNRMLWTSSDKGSWYKRQRLQLPPEELPKKNRKLRPSDVSYDSDEFIWWQCKKNKEHVWYAMVSARTIDGADCPLCHMEANSLITVKPGVARLWHPTRNRPLDPSEVTVESTEKVWWRCFKSGDHVWKDSVRMVVAAWDNGVTRCPACTGKKGGTLSLLTRYPALVKQWHPQKNLPLQPSQVTFGSRQTVWWRCLKNEEHVWQAPVANVVRRHKLGNSGCPFCAGKRKLDSK
ncbi:MAG TPA: zinc-ribbon domain-containing protein [Planktothrix sp.]